LGKTFFIGLLSVLLLVNTLDLMVLADTIDVGLMELVVVTGNGETRFADESILVILGLVMTAGRESVVSENFRVNFCNRNIAPKAIHIVKINSQRNLRNFAEILI